MSFFSINATRTSCLARYVNDAPEKYSKCAMKIVMVNGIPKLALVVKQNIQSNMTLLCSCGLGNAIFGQFILPVSCSVQKLMYCK